jgi:hypothetical protein
VNVWAIMHGHLTAQMRCVSSLSNCYDLALVNHNTCLQHVLSKGVSNRTVFTSHGTRPSVDQPMIGADKYVAVSERVKQHLKNLNFDATVIQNGVDLHRFRPIGHPARALRRIGFLSRHVRAVPMLGEACDRIGCAFWHIRDQSDVPAAINACDAVVSIGRGVIECLACARPVLILDHPIASAPPRTDGWFSIKDASKSAYWNYTGWFRNIIPTVDVIVGYLRQYSPRIADGCRDYVAKHHNIQSSVQKYLELAK